MTYKMTDDEWEKICDFERALAERSKRKKKPVPMRPINQRVIRRSRHFVIMTANTTPWMGWNRRGMRYALIELSDPLITPTRIDRRLKAIRRLLAVRTVYNLNRVEGQMIQKRYWRELEALHTKCERLYPCHFLVKGINYDPPKTYLDSEEFHKAQTHTT